MSNYEQSKNKRRFTAFVIALSLLVAGLLVRFAFLMLGPEHNAYGPYSQRNEPVIARGNILDRNGRILAMATRLGNVTLWKPDMIDVFLLSSELAPILELPVIEIEERILNSQSDFLYIKRQVEDAALKRIEAAIAEGSLRGIGIEPAVGRIYPEGNLASQIIGFTGDEGKGLAGIEYAFEQDLTYFSGSRSGRGQRNGNQVFLTIDVNVQNMLENIAGQVFRNTQAEAVMCLAMDPRNGDILGSASLPGFDPNNFKDSNESSRMNRPAIWAYEPGSVFKVFSLAALLDSGAVSDNSYFYCDGHYERTTNRGEKLTINCLGVHGRISPREIIIYSCNAGAAYAADQLGSESFYEILTDFGFGNRIGSGNPGETAGFFRTTDRWSERSKPTISMGQEIAVSALQVLKAASVIANDGVMVPPRVVLKINSPDNRSSHEYLSGEPKRIIRAETAKLMRDYMTDVTSNIGTGWRAYMGDISMAVKTGTAQFANPVTGGYSETDFIASSLALLPAESPSLVLYLVIVKPKGETWGGRIAAPAIREAAEALINYLGIPRGRNPQIFHSGEITIPLIPNPEITDTVPDFIGLPKNRLVQYTERNDLNFRILGDGWVKRQSPPPGTPLERDTLIILELE